MSGERVLILADDLIWSTRLVGHVRQAAGEPRAVRSTDAWTDGLAGADGAIVDLTSRAYDGLAAIATARDAGVPVLAVGQHDDAELRRRALAAGADRVYPYRQLFEDGPRQMARWLTGEAVATATPVAPESPR